MIVVIAILAAISIVAYNGIQQRANNTSTTLAASQVLKAIASYGTLNGTYPVPGNNQFCVVPAENGSCTAHSTVERTMSAIFNSNIATIANLPTSVPNGHSDFMGITANYSTTRTVNGEPRPLAIQYSLHGNQLQCGLPNVVNQLGNMLSTTGYTISSGGYTTCIISVTSP